MLGIGWKGVACKMTRRAGVGRGGRFGRRSGRPPRGVGTDRRLIVPPPRVFSVSPWLWRQLGVSECRGGAPTRESPRERTLSPP